MVVRRKVTGRFGSLDFGSGLINAFSKMDHPEVR